MEKEIEKKENDIKQEEVPEEKITEEDLDSVSGGGVSTKFKKISTLKYYAG